MERTFRDLVGEAIGEASVCWSELPHGVFNSTRAEELVDIICTAVDRKTQLAALINGHMEAMRPLLDEWSKLK